MYCRDTGDLATEHIAGLPNLKEYYAGQPRITDRSLEILGTMPSLAARGTVAADVVIVARKPVAATNANGSSGPTR